MVFVLLKKRININYEDTYFITVRRFNESIKNNC